MADQINETKKLSKNPSNVFEALPVIAGLVRKAKAEQQKTGEANEVSPMPSYEQVDSVETLKRPEIKNETMELVDTTPTSNMVSHDDNRITEGDSGDENEPSLDPEVAKYYASKEKESINNKYDYLQAMAAVNPYFDPSNELYQSTSNALEEERSNELSGESERKRQFNPGDEINRRFTDANGDILPIQDWNLLGWTSQQKSPEVVNNVYEQVFQDDSEFIGPRIRDNQDPDTMYNNSVLGGHLNLDDGSKFGSNEGQFMTGDRYLQYRNAGLPGRPVSEIDPNATYSKQSEMNEYGFIPYLVTDEGFNRFHDAASMNMLSDVFNSDVANVRDNSTRHTYSMDGKKLEGDLVDKESKLWSDRYREQMNDPDNVVTQVDIDNGTKSVEDISEYAVPFVYEYTMTTDNGQTDQQSGRWESFVQNADGTLAMTWPDGTVWEFDDIDDFESHVTNNGRLANENDSDESVEAWVNVDPMKLDDGTVLRADVAAELLGNKDDYADYGFMNIAKPHPDEDKVFEGDFLPWIIDAIAGSSPLFDKRTAMMQAIPSAFMSDYGINTYRDPLTGSYSELAENGAMDDERYLTATLGNLSLPITEHLIGNIGGSLVGKILKKDLSNLHPALQLAAGTAGEAAEEIPGNIVEEIIANGTTDWYADDKVDENGNVVYDSQGNPEKEDTPWSDRFRNFWADAPLSALAGGIMGGMFGLPQIPGQARRYNLNKALEAEGYTPIKIPKRPMNILVDLTDEEKDYYNG